MYKKCPPAWPGVLLGKTIGVNLWKRGKVPQKQETFLVVAEQKSRRRKSMAVDKVYQV